MQPSVRVFIAKVCQHNISQATLGEIDQLYSFGTFGDEDEMIGFWGQRLKVKVVAKPHMIKIHFRVSIEH